MLDNWVEAKRRRNYALSDQIRDKLKERGIKPDEARPAGGDAADWTCICGARNWARRDECFKCQAARPT